MRHPDEGTIHAWLDGELAPDEAAALAAHVAECATCAATVAEARGLVAASARILNALDDVPRDVSPTSRRATRSPRPTNAGLRRRRPFYRHPQFAAAAAVAVLAVGTMTVLRRSPGAVSEAPAPVAAQRMDSAALGTAPPPAPAGPEVGTGAVAAGVPASPKSVAVTATPASEKRSLRDAGPEGGARRGEASASSGVDAAGTVGAIRTLAADAPRREIAQEAVAAEAKVDRLARTTADSTPPAPTTIAAAPVPRAAPRADSVVAAEARRLEGERKANLQPMQVAATGAASSVERRRAEVDASRAPLCYELARTPLTQQLGVPERIVLLPQRAPNAGDRAWYAARDPGSNVVNAWIWAPGEGDLVQLARADGTPASPRQPVTISPTGDRAAVRATRVPCTVP